jgi:hypothetical protein
MDWYLLPVHNYALTRGYSDIIRLGEIKLGLVVINEVVLWVVILQMI